jgi:hypothetical protein
MSKNAKARKARKRVKRELRKVTGHCLGCGWPLRRMDAKCRNCRRPSPLYAGTKSVSALLVKSAGGNIVPIWKARGPRLCPLGHGAGGIGEQFCATCGTPLGLGQGEYLSWLRKTQAPGAGTFLAKSLATETDPQQCAAIEHRLYQDAAQRGAVIPFMLKVHGYSSLEQAVDQETDPTLHGMFWRAAHPEIYGHPGGAA